LFTFFTSQSDHRIYLRARRAGSEQAGKATSSSSAIAAKVDGSVALTAEE
jgi:hypothetical protein